MKISAKEANDMCIEAASKLRCNFYDHLSKKIHADEIPDMKHKEVSALADYVEGQMITLMFPFLDGGRLPDWMLPVNTKGSGLEE